ncbi:superoxide dismutase [Luteolibacter ambystomatis]|uniref:Superoxide dismutase n=1 Tax=Luteolibacter ambystomatis TaxID=2824561 RepID=A0A975G873_9BACT|nr:superoxide dismutase [Luteolibacter ambystomatis]QUE50095.1 superoxide dismutase [Luteolibacter ambystomatis]
MNPEFNRRTFVKLGALAAASTALVPGKSNAAEVIVLPDLPYAKDALEPHIDALTMEIHHDKHHAAYIAKFNEARAKNEELMAEPLIDTLRTLPSINDEALRTTLRNNGGGHWNHSFFWETLAPADKSGKPSDELAKAIDKAFGSFDAFKTAFAEAATKRFGSGWAWLIATADDKLKVVSTPNQDNPLMKGIVPAADQGTPILGLDVWEHAYYLHYQNKRLDYINAWWNVVNWSKVNERFKKTV